MSGKSKQRRRLGIPPQTVDARKGTPLWAFNRFRSEILSTLLNDLVRHEAHGIDDATCQQIRLRLEAIVNYATELPDGGFLRSSVFTDLNRFKSLYEQWNQVDRSNPKGRKKALDKLRKRRQHLSQTIRKNQYILEQELDLQLVRALYQALNNLVSAVPDAGLIHCRRGKIRSTRFAS